ncbi:hypothetical protein [Burkholderia sp. PU8-34]
MGHFRKWAVVFGLAAAYWLSANPSVQAKPFSAELRFDIKKGEPGLPNEYTKLEFVDGSNRYVALVRRSGKVVSEGGFAARRCRTGDSTK